MGRALSLASQRFSAPVAIDPDKAIGRFWERCAYLEDLVLYIQMCSPTYAVDKIQRAVEYVLGQVEKLEEVAPYDKLHERVRRLETRSARDLRSSTQ